MPVLARRERWISMGFIAPALLGLIIFRLLPIGISLWQSLYGLPGREGYVGLRNYLDLWSNPAFWNSLKKTLVFNAITNPFQVAIAFCLALLANTHVAAVSVYRSLILAPITTSITVTSILWGIMLNPSIGLINGVLAHLHVPPQPFLSSPQQAMPSLILLATWRGMGYWMVFFLAGLQDIPPSLYEAAAIDGAGAFQKLWTITLPLMRRVFAFVLAADTAVNFLFFVPIYLLTSGGPQSSTDFLMYETYKTTFVYLDLGHGMALASCLLIIILSIVMAELRLIRA